MFAVMYGRRLFSSVFAITERREMGLYEVPMWMSLFGLGMGTMFANFHVCGIIFLLRAVFNMLVRNASPRGPMCFRCLMFRPSGPCELLFLLCLIASWTWKVVSVMVCPCIFCIDLSIDLYDLFVACLTMLVNCFVKQFAICLGLIAIFLLNVMVLLSVGGGTLLDRPCMVFHRVCVLCL